MSSPRLILPLTFEPYKLRLHHDERFLNLWIRDVRSSSPRSASVCAWVRVQATSELHTSDQMSLDSNCRKDKSGNLSPHYSPWPSPNSSAVNVFAQPLPFDNSREVKHDVNGRRQTAKIASDFLFCSCNP